ncbi:hypothetical protein AGABI1DRAFT_109653 [Agaricus bisporus var. burnettii JB137-S8]|uniref:NADP-dependent oxidoreductase domain-containing protein n=1 Tax=Agaricus bisporus var. burnettii (strain JB137-S8 / ATCC MYA-4627 / FGSC 10392) TaxID=597362 RepID=K5WWG2_AGABU|nr:hypothetical protein AGABI2DRAFT_226244 [Agaricus bisporus var. bisporus H97]XP_007334269.1 uncharacterized protein AGABI1DRAFT_109653 [Agaricus bisporus var. burnettii JB137-S8]EKM75128.1 hypothetical protein AGABI1DRAFT_109653 [Agaricus bisporus var. burnettii JB137-S8]EKV44861.1 hypothetical protein AGABI2DRAFT_226244 [Agaricus bisporus var. bisporus H97]
MSSPIPPPREFSRLGQVSVPRIWTGLWQLSSSAWGSADLDDIKKSMGRLVDSGYYFFADHYGPAESIVGDFARQLPDSSKLYIATKWCVFHKCIPTREVVLEAVKGRLRGLQTKRIDLLQFHWQDYNDKAYLDALYHLQCLQLEGYISNIGLCNFDTKHVDEICTQLGPGAIVSNQVQFSIIDTRPLHGMGDVCMKHDVKLLTYGTLCGNFLSDRWLGQPSPDPYGEEVVLTPSQRKYLDIILISWGSWELFQSLLRVLRLIGDRHGGLSIANIAMRWVLDHPFVGGVLIGARLGITEHFTDNAKVFNFRLSPQDRADIEEILARSNSRRLITTIGDCGAEYRA